MPDCTDEPIELGKVGRRVIEASFVGGDIVSDGEFLLLRKIDQRIGLIKAVARVFDDRRRRARVSHSMRDLLAQRIYGLCCGWEDVCDHKCCVVTCRCKRQLAGLMIWPRRQP